jgi:hypothetical protein
MYSTLDTIPTLCWRDKDISRKASVVRSVPGSKSETSDSELRTANRNICFTNNYTSYAASRKVAGSSPDEVDYFN